ncbi:MAG: BlaI/MecI/CopY family transcriptional regulator [Acidimicrobiales bacterium]
MSPTTTCDNPRCTCDACTCVDCKCGVPSLGELERRVMGVLWEDPGRELTGREVANVLSGYAYTTVATVLDRLAHKGLVSRRMDGRTIRFGPTGSQAAHTAEVMREALLVSQDADSALVRFAETLSRSEASVLRRTLDELKRRPRRSGR